VDTVSDRRYRRVGAIGVRAGLDPAARPCVVIQYPDQWLTVRPVDARAIAAALIEAADEAEEIGG
jgi:hypothetical protein